MLDHLGIQLLLRGLLLKVNAAILPDPDSRIAWENIDFIPPDPKAEATDGSLWIRETGIPGREQQVGYEMLELTAQMQYDVIVPAGGGIEEAKTLAKAIGDVFKPGQGFTSTGPSGSIVTVSLVQCDLLQGSKTVLYGNEWYATPVLITFRSYGPRV